MQEANHCFQSTQSFENGVSPIPLAGLIVDKFLTYLWAGIVVGAPCPAKLIKRILSDTHMTEIAIASACGMTETEPVNTQTKINDPVSRRVETVGRVLPHTEIKTVDDEGHFQIGAPDEKYGEVVYAWIKLRKNHNAIAEDIIPRFIKFVDSFPKTMTGKVQKYVKRKQRARGPAEVKKE